MRFDIAFTPEALEDLRLFKKGERASGYYGLTDSAFSTILKSRLIW
jgi:hypothetical protein